MQPAASEMQAAAIPSMAGMLTVNVCVELIGKAYASRVEPRGTDQPSPSRKPPLHAELLTWSALLAQCVRFAQAAVALPSGEDAVGQEGDAWRSSIPRVIELQAVWFALERSGDLPPDERAIGRDRAAVALQRNASALRDAWRETPQGMPSGVADLIADVERHLA